MNGTTTIGGYDPRDFPYETPRTLSNFLGSNVKIAFLNLEDRFTLVNAAFCRALGFDADQLRGGSILELIDAQNHDTYFGVKNTVDEEATWPSRSCPLTIRKACGTLEIFSLSLASVRNEEGEVQSYRIVLRDGEEFRREVARKIPNDIWHPHAVVAAVNGQGYLTRQDGRFASDAMPNFVGKHYRTVFADQPEACARVERAMAGETFTVEVFTRGTWAQCWYQPLYSELGQLDGATWTYYPVDKQKRLEARLTKAVTELQEATRLREDLLSMAAHEIRSPLATLSMQLQLLELRLEAGVGFDQIQSVAQMVIESGRRQINTVSNLVQRTLDVSRIHEHGMRIDKRVCELGAVVRDVICRNEDLAKLRQQSVDFVCPAEVVGVWDPLRLEQVVDNLLSNAFKYGLGRPIHVALHVTGGLATLAVRDQGAGIRPEDQLRIFGRFERCAEHRGLSGLGIGLYIVKQIVEAHDGFVQIHSDLGQGTTFRVVLPLK